VSRQELRNELLNLLERVARRAEDDQVRSEDGDLPQPLHALVHRAGHRDRVGQRDVAVDLGEAGTNPVERGAARWAIENDA
jgi:hypothetical protein